MAVRCFILPPKKRIILRVARQVFDGFEEFKEGQKGSMYAHFREFLFSLKEDVGELSLPTSPSIHPYSPLLLALV